MQKIAKVESKIETGKQVGCVADVVRNKIGKAKFPNLVTICNDQSAHVTTVITNDKSLAENYHVCNGYQ